MFFLVHEKANEPIIEKNDHILIFFIVSRFLLADEIFGLAKNQAKKQITYP